MAANSGIQFFLQNRKPGKYRWLGGEIEYKMFNLSRSERAGYYSYYYKEIIEISQL
jgi:hypothetical protein